MATIISKSPEETHALGVAWGITLEPGTVLGLCGDLGAGKTRLVQGIAEGIGYAGRVCSPTFALVREYLGGRCPLYHLDLYRLETAETLVSAGLEGYLSLRDGVVVVEWFDRWSLLAAQQADARSWVRGRLRLVRITTLGGQERQIDYEDTCPRI